MSRIALLLLLAAFALAACIPTQMADPAPLPTATAPGLTPITTPDGPPATTSLPTVEPSATPSPTPTEAPPTPTPNPVAGWTVDDLAAREYGGSGIVIGDALGGEDAFTQYGMTFDSDGLTITGLANIPAGDGPFPVVIVNHGYCAPETYRQGCDSAAVGAAIARYGYITLTPDYRGYWQSDDGPNPFRIGYALDVMNLIAQVDSLPQAAPGQIGVIGHSMGGGVSMWPMVLPSEVDAVVLYAAMNGDMAVNWQHIRLNWNTRSQDELAAIYGTPDENPAGYAAISPINYLDRVSVPVLIQHGTADDQVPYIWSQELDQALEAAGKDVTFNTYEGENHILYGSAFDRLIASTVAFFDEHVRQAADG
jgi:dipeptidyl aminopeptidase/acylaminoacyl peptidase